MKRVCVGLIVAVLLGGGIAAQKPPLLPEKDVAALANELSGETAKRNLEGIARFHRQRGSQGFHEAAELVAERLRAYGLSDVAILQFPADGKIFYGTQRSRPPWDAQVGNLGELWFDPKWCEEHASQHEATAKDTKPEPIGPECSPRERTLGSYEAEPVVVAEDSESGEATANLVDVGEGTKESDYAGKQVKGNIVLVSAQPGAVQDFAVGTFGAAGIVSYAQNQKTAWWGEDENLIRWGHLETFSPNKTFAFMVSLKTARGLRERLAKGEKIMLHAVVKAGQHPGNYEVVTATIPGADAKLKGEEIAFSCHLDHQRPGANDNASGCVTILEVARTLAKLTRESTTVGCIEPATKRAAKTETEKKYAEWLKDCEFLIGAGTLQRPARTIRFIFPPEIEGTMALLNAKPEFAKRIKAVVHMDMVGGEPETKAVFHVTGGPMSLPSFVHKVAWAFAEWVNEESYKFAATGKADYPLVAPEGGKEPLRAEYSAYTMGSDHDVYQDSSFGIPAIYLNDWPDRYIHTNFDSAANIDPTKLKRAAFIGAASAYFLAGKHERAERDAIFAAVGLAHGEVELAEDRQKAQLEGSEAANFSAYRFAFERSEFLRSLRRFVGDNCVPSEGPDCLEVKVEVPLTPVPGRSKKGEIAYERKPGVRFRRSVEPKGPLAVFGYDYFAEHAKAAGVTTPKLLSYEGLWGSGEEYAYEVLNFADGKRNAQEIRDAVSAEYGPVPLELVVEYLKALEKIGVVEQVK